MLPSWSVTHEEVFSFFVLLVAVAAVGVLGGVLGRGRADSWILDTPYTPSPHVRAKSRNLRCVCFSACGGLW